MHIWVPQRSTFITWVHCEVKHEARRMSALRQTFPQGSVRAEFDSSFTIEAIAARILYRSRISMTSKPKIIRRSAAVAAEISRSSRLFAYLYKD